MYVLKAREEMQARRFGIVAWISGFGLPAVEMAVDFGNN